jgi:dTDP-4-amino-4,6-dideoxygalactose transaminase
VKDKIITVTSPLIPPLAEYMPYLQDIWERRWLTNNGHYHEELEKELAAYLKISHISLFSNGTLALIAALQALRITGEVITTPYSFVATTHSLWWNNIKPVFVDIDPVTLNIDPRKIEAAITPQTTAIMPVHVYGTPSDVEEIRRIADTYGLKVIYDAAHAFAVEKDGVSILNYGDLSILSFHATKTYSTVEGGAIICHTPEMKTRIDYLKNFGFVDEVTVIAPGINAKLNELQAAYGLLSLKYVDKAIADRKACDTLYREGLRNIEGIRVLDPSPGVKANYSYFPIFVDKEVYGVSRDELYERLKRGNVLARRYFYPLISDFPTYNGLPSAARSNLPVAALAADQVICLPMHDQLSEDDVRRVVRIIKERS